LFQDQAGNLMAVGIDLDRSHFLNNVPQAKAAPRSPKELTLHHHIQTLQTITPAGEKRFEPGSKKSGAMFLIGEPSLRQMYFDQEWPKPLFQALEPKNILIAEGYATAATLHQATGLPVAVAFDAGNLKPVAEALQRTFPEASLTICADHDHGHKINVGLNKAYEAAKAVGAVVIFPHFTDEEKARGLTDFNDLAQDCGLNVVTEHVFCRVGLGLAKPGEQAAAPSLAL
ncbi:MAG: toprim domain-containing protein, partial [Candidatus Adiutrix sp.]|nr:toprim domain-containing protein [Candidatus Adiutrix sp.]